MSNWVDIRIDNDNSDNSYTVYVRDDIGVDLGNWKKFTKQFPYKRSDSHIDDASEYKEEVKNKVTDYLMDKQEEWYIPNEYETYDPNDREDWKGPDLEDSDVRNGLSIVEFACLYCSNHDNSPISAAEHIAEEAVVLG